MEALIEKEIRKNAKDQFVGELAQILILTKAYGCTLEYEHKPIQDDFEFMKEWENKKPKLFFNF